MKKFTSSGQLSQLLLARQKADAIRFLRICSAAADKSGDFERKEALDCAAKLIEEDYLDSELDWKWFWENLLKGLHIISNAHLLWMVGQIIAGL